MREALPGSAPAPEPAAARSRRLPLAWRLSLVMALVSALCCAGLGLYLYQSFAAQLQRRDELQLLGKLRQLRQLLGHSATPQLLLEQADYLRDTMSGESNALIEIRAAADRRLLLSINARKEPLPAGPALALERPAQLSDLQRWQGSGGEPAAGLVARARLGTASSLPGTEVNIHLARLYPERAALLAEYRLRILAASLLAALAAAALALGLGWQGLRPLRRLSAQAGAIQASTLSTRLSEEQAPPEIAAMLQAYNAMLARLEQGFARLNQFAADLAHELRTPLATLLGQSQVMLSRPRSAEELRALLESNLEELEGLQRMVDQLLFLARADEGALPLQLQPLGAAEELARQADYFEDLAEERQLRIECRPAAAAEQQEQAPLRLWADPPLLRRALANLLANALRHARPGSAIVLQAGQQGEELILSVRNLGEPLPPALLPQLFERFVRADPARGPAADGSSHGLGLAIVRSIMGLHGGRATVSQQAQLDEPAASEISFHLHFPTHGRDSGAARRVSSA